METNQMIIEELTRVEEDLVSITIDDSLNTRKKFRPTHKLSKYRKLYSFEIWECATLNDELSISLRFFSNESAELFQLVNSLTKWKNYVSNLQTILSTEC